MRNINSNSTPQFFNPTQRYSTTGRAGQRPVSTATALALIRRDHPEIVERVASTIHHPRSLARTPSTWRPPTLSLPAVDIAGFPELKINITRYRANPAMAAALAHGPGSPTPAYAVIARFTNPTGDSVPPAVYEAWMRAFIPHDAASMVHEIITPTAPTYCWVVDSTYTPVPSPASFFVQRTNAA
ncbi:hypothetical protein [Corynebacterium ciconiae]|uniref:hypothetical protein n=1 Tax=Corynebacterium ciconiae TaxID=227319 RepID=UPI001FCC1B4D|nr:hypothetical protein [Corynebacterium ciconiae]